MEPPPSLPTPAAEQQAAIAAASPPLEPPAVRDKSQGLLVRPYMRLSVSHAMRSSGQLVTPRTIAPAARRRLTKVASRFGTYPFLKLVPASQRNPATSMELLMLMGTPLSAPRPAPCCTAHSAARASRRARS